MKSLLECDCGYGNRVIYYGKLYLTRVHLCLYSKVFGMSKKVISFDYHLAANNFFEACGSTLKYFQDGKGGKFKD